MDKIISGLHHVTAIAGNPQRNVDFYAGILGLRLVKRTVNFDEYTTYHLYYGDGSGSPGSLLTFFAWPDGNRGRQGTGQVATCSLAVRPASFGYWIERFVRYGIRFEGPSKRFDEQVLAFRDHDGLALELVSHPQVDDQAAWDGGPVPAEHAIRGLYSVTLWEGGFESTAKLLTETLGFRPLREDQNLYRYTVGSSGPGTFVDIRDVAGFWEGEVGVGNVHHVAWHTPDDAQQLEWRQTLLERDLDVTPVRDRHYFKSIYVNEPGGALFEIATDSPGFTIDEPLAQLGNALMLPPWLEERRKQIEALLPPLYLPDAPKGFD